jgi:hypothetical protein
MSVGTGVLLQVTFNKCHTDPDTKRDGPLITSAGRL